MSGVKLVFLGDPGVGKSCLIARFILGVYDTYKLGATEGKCVSKTIEIPEIGESISLDIWDTLGQEKYRSLTKIFLQGAKMVILVYDITRKDSYDNMKSEWYKLIKEGADPDVLIGIAGNKSDRYDDEAVTEQEARYFAENIGAVFSLTSAQNNSGINELFKELVKKYLGPIPATIESNIQKEEQKVESKQDIKLDEKDVAKKNEKKKKKKDPCYII